MILIFSILQTYFQLTIIDLFKSALTHVEMKEIPLLNADGLSMFIYSFLLIASMIAIVYLSNNLSVTIAHDTHEKLFHIITRLSQKELHKFSSTTIVNHPEHYNTIVDIIIINKIHPDSYKNIFGYVPSEKWIFEGTIAENIGYGLDKYDLEDVKKACETIGFNEIIESKPNKYETKISDEKNIISNSEKELICIARAIIENPKILIFDDINVDINNIIDGKTTFIITNDKKILEMSDRIIELNIVNTVTDNFDITED